MADGLQAARPGCAAPEPLGHAAPHLELPLAQTDLDARLTAIIAPVVAAMGFDLVRVMLSGQPGSLTLQVMAEDPATGQLISRWTMRIRLPANIIWKSPPPASTGR